MLKGIEPRGVLIVSLLREVMVWYLALGEDPMGGSMTSSYGDFMACCGRLVVVKDAVRLKENKTGVGVIWRATTKYRMSGSCEWNHVISACSNPNLHPHPE